MNQEQAKELGKLLRQRRMELKLTQRQLATNAHMGDSTIARLEHGRFLAPSPAKLSQLAKALQLPLADLFARASYLVPDELPSFNSYLSVKYPKLPKSALTELRDHFERLAKHHGLTTDPTDPKGQSHDQVGAAA